jgi:hypothetical protein
MKTRTKAPNFALTKQLNENTDKSTKFWLKVWQDWPLAREYMMLTLYNVRPSGTTSETPFRSGKTSSLPQP